MSTTRAAPGRGALAVAVLGLALAGTLAAARTAPGRDVVAAAGAFLEYYAGVFTLVTLTGAVFFGAIAALRMLPPGPRVVVQALHRSAAVTAVGFLVTHALLKVMEAHAKPLDLVVPTSPSWVALGTISGDLLILAAASGAVRGRYAATVRPWAWRTLHCTVYVTWPIALAHGLMAGRAPKSWVTISYLVCAAAVIGILLLRSATTSRHEPPGSVPLPDLSSLAEPRHGDGERSGPRTASFTGSRAETGPGGRRTDPLTSEPPPGDPDPAGPRTGSFGTEATRSGADRAGTRTASFTDEPDRADGGRAGFRTAPGTASLMDDPRADGDRTDSRMASFADEPVRDDGGRAGFRTAPGTASFMDDPQPVDQARLRAASGTASYVDPPRRAMDPAGSRTAGPFPAAGPPPGPQTPTSGPFPAAPSSDPFPAAPSSDPFPAAASSGPFPAADGSGAGNGDRLVAGAFGDRAWPPPPPPPPASIADLIGEPGADPGDADRARPRTASGGAPTPPIPPRIEDVIADAGGPDGTEPAGFSPPASSPHAPGSQPRTTLSGTTGSGDVRVASGPHTVNEPHRGRDPVAASWRPADPGVTPPRAAPAGTGGGNAVRTPRRPADTGPRPGGRKGKKGRHQSRSIDEQDAAFWASLRAERPDWTRP